MTIKLYDPIQAIKRLHKAGVQKEMAEAFVEELRESQECSLQDIATKQDIKDLKNELELMRRDIQNLEQKMINKIGSMMIIAVGIIIAVIKL